MMHDAVTPLCLTLASRINYFSQLIVPLSGPDTKRTFTQQFTPSYGTTSAVWPTCFLMVEEPCSSTTMVPVRQRCPDDPLRFCVAPLLPSAGDICSSYFFFFFCCLASCFPRADGSVPQSHTYDRIVSEKRLDKAPVTG